MPFFMSSRAETAMRTLSSWSSSETEDDAGEGAMADERYTKSTCHRQRPDSRVEGGFPYRDIP